MLNKQPLWHWHLAVCIVISGAYRYFFPVILSNGFMDFGYFYNRYLAVSRINIISGMVCCFMVYTMRVKQGYILSPLLQAVLNVCQGVTWLLEWGQWKWGMINCQTPGKTINIRGKCGNPVSWETFCGQNQALKSLK